MRDMMRAIVSLLLTGSLLSGCVSSPPRSPAPGPIPAAGAETPNVPDADEAAMLASVLKQVSKAKTNYRISAADLINVTVYQDAEMSRRTRVNARGAISLPLVGTVIVGGMTLLQAQKAVEAKLARYLVDPQASLFIEEYGNRTIFVMGEVQKPGSYSIPTESRLTVLEAISTAGGFTRIAAQDRTRVLRDVNGKSESFTVEVTAITQKGEKEKDIVLLPNDVIFVPQSFF